VTSRALVEGPTPAPTVFPVTSDGRPAPSPSPWWAPTTRRARPGQRHVTEDTPLRPPAAPSASPTRTAVKPASSRKPMSPAPTAASASMQAATGLTRSTTPNPKSRPWGWRDPPETFPSPARRHRHQRPRSPSTAPTTARRQPRPATTPKTSPVTFNVLGNDTDPDGDTLSVTGATVDPAKGSVVVNADGTLTFTPAPNVNGPVESPTPSATARAAPPPAPPRSTSPRPPTPPCSAPAAAPSRKTPRLRPPPPAPSASSTRMPARPPSSR
jgi:hypothetical protein